MRPGTLALLKEALGCACICIAIRDADSYVVQHSSRGIPPATEDRSIPVCDVGPDRKLNTRNERLENYPADRLLIDSHSASDGLQYYRGCCSPAHRSFCLGAPLAITGGLDGVAAAHWQDEESGDPFERKRLLRILLPHIARAVSVEHHLASLRAEAAGSAYLMERVTHAVMVVDGDGRVLRTNHSAERLLALNTGLCLVDGHLQMEWENSIHTLKSLIAKAITLGHSQGEILTSVARSSRDRPLSVSITSLLDAGAAPAPGQTAAVVIASDPQCSAPLPWRTLRDLFGLTRNEARLAARLGNGDSLHDAAVQLGISYRTAALHLEHALRKTNTHRQSELIRLLLMSPAIFADDSNADRS